MTDQAKELAEAVGQASAVMDALATIQPGDRVYLYRKSLDTLKYGYLGPVETGEDPAEFLDLVKRRWGGGDYRAVRWGLREDGGKGFIPAAAGGAVLFSIEGRPKYDEPEPSPDDAGGSKLEAVVAGLVETIREERQSRSDELMKMLFDSNARMMEAVAGRPQPEAADPTRMLEVFLEGMDRGREAAGDSAKDGTPDPYEGVAARLMDMVQTAGAVAPAPEALPNPEPMDDPPGAAALALREYLPNLLQAARARIPAHQVAAAVLAKAEPEAVSLVLVDPTVIDDVVHLEPRFGRWRSWLRDVLDELDAMTNDDGGDYEPESNVDPGAPDGGGADSGSGGVVPG